MLGGLGRRRALGLEPQRETGRPLRIDEDDGNAHVHGFLNAAAGLGIRSVFRQDGDQDIAPARHGPGAVHKGGVARRPRRGIGVKNQDAVALGQRRRLEQGAEIRNRLEAIAQIEGRLIVRNSERQNGAQQIVLFQPGMRDQAVGAFGQRGDDDEV